MTTTTNWLATYPFARLGFALVIEGLDTAFCTGMSTSEAATAWAGTPWASSTWRGGLQIAGTMGQKIDLFDAKIDHDSLTFEIVDVANALIALVARPLSTAGAKTYLGDSVNVDEDDTAVTVMTTSAFAASGYIYMGTETAHYSSLSAPSFTHITRAKFELDLTNGGSDFAKAHRRDPVTNVKPVISDYPRRHYNRRVWLYLHHREDGVWSTKANATLIWTGSVRSIEDHEGALSISCINAKHLLSQTLLVSQFHGDLAQGVYFSSEYNGIWVREMVAGVWQAAVSGTLAGAGSVRTWQELYLAVYDFLQANRASLTFDWTIGESGIVGELRVRIYNTVATPAVSGVAIGMSQAVWGALGYNDSGDPDWLTIGGTTYLLNIKSAFGSEDVALTAANAPIIYPYGTGLKVGREIRLNDTDGIWANQPVIPNLSPALPSTTDGFLQIGDHVIVAVNRATATSYTVTADVTKELFDDASGMETPFVIRVGDNEGPIRVKQVWFERDETRDVFLRLLLSTGTTNYNHATYDKNGYGMGLGLPASLVDINSFELLGTEQYQVLITKPASFLTYMESALTCRGLYLILKSGKFTLRRPRFDGQNITAAWDVTEANKARPDEHTRITYSSEGLVNRVEIRYNQRLGGAWRRSITVEDMVSITDFGVRRTVQLDGHGIMREEDAYAWRDVAADALAYFSRELAVVERSYDLSLVAMVPGDTVLIDDNYMVDPRAGTRGVTNYPGWVLDASFNWEKGEGRVRIACLPDLDYTRIGAWAPAARVDETAANGGYNVATKVLTVKLNAYSVAGGTADSARFDAGDLITVREVSATAGLSWTDEIVDVTTTTTVTLTDGLAGWDSTKQYILEFRVKTAVVTSQKDISYIADDVTNGTGDAADDAYHWGGLPDVDYASPAVAYTNRFYQVPATIDDTAAPLTVADYYDLLQGMNGLLAYGTRFMMSDFLLTNAAVTGTTKTRLYGPVWIPCMGLGYDRTLLVRLYGRHTNTVNVGTFTITTSPTIPYGTADNAMVVLPDATEFTATLTTKIATDTWVGEASINMTPQLDDAEGPAGVWLMVEGVASAAGETLTLAGITVAESALS